MHLLFLQKQEGANKVIKQPSVAALFGVNFADLKAVKADSHIACRANAVPLPCLAAMGLECVFTI
jgi:hypothetical protein